MIKEILESNFTTLATLAILVFALACPGMLTIAVYFPDLYRSLEFSKLLALSIAGCAPFILLNSVMLTEIVKEILPGTSGVKLPDELKSELLRLETHHSAVFALFPLYVPLIARMIYECPLKHAIVLALGTHILIRVVATRYLKFLRRRMAADNAQEGSTSRHLYHKCS